MALSTFTAERDIFKTEKDNQKLKSFSVRVRGSKVYSSGTLGPRIKGQGKPGTFTRREKSLAESQLGCTGMRTRGRQVPRSCLEAEMMTGRHRRTVI